MFGPASSFLVDRYVESLVYLVVLHLAYDQIVLEESVMVLEDSGSSARVVSVLAIVISSFLGISE